MSTTKIDCADMKINPIVGCSHCSPGCDNCKAERIAARLAKHPNPKISGKYAGVVDENGKWTGKVNLDFSCFDKLPRNPQRIFVGSMTDIFHTDAESSNYSKSYFPLLFDAMASLPQHTFMLLTKRPENMRRWIDFTLEACVDEPLPNLWLGVSVCNQAEADEKIPVLLQTPAAKRFVSVEPMLGPIDLVGWGGIRQGENPYPERWLNFAWPEWVPAKVRQEIESFWSWETYKRTPRQWADNAVQNCGGIALGSLVGVDNVTWKGSKTVRPYNDYRSYRTGRFVHAWNNMCRVVYDDGTFDYASYDGRFYLSEYCVPGTDKYRSLINWVICGGETGPRARPIHPDWVRSLRDQCQAAGVPFFFKGWGEWGATARRLDTGIPSFRMFQSFIHYCNKAPIWISKGDKLICPDGHIPHNGAEEGKTYPMCIVRRVGKRRAGRLLDGREWCEVPEVKA